MYGGREPGGIGIRGTIPHGTRLIGVGQDLFETINADVRALDFVQDTLRARRFLIREGLQWSATNTPDTAARPGEGIGQPFAQRAAAFVVIPAGRNLASGVNHFNYWFGSGTAADILGVQPVSGLQHPLQFTARLDPDIPGILCRLQVIAPEATTLAEALLLMVYRLHVGGR